MPAPTFLCIGAQKCGTTWLATAVQQHPGVATGVKKELHFFNHEQAYARGLGWYEEQFRARPQTRAIGEFTPNYWWTAGTTTTNNLLGSHDRVADAYPDLQLVVCLRDPVDRAVSAYFHHMNVGRFGPSVGLLEAVERYPDIREFGLYATQLAAWRSRYAAERFLVLTYEDDIRPDAAKPRTLRRVYRHLGVWPGFESRDIATMRNQRNDHFDIRLRHASPGSRAMLERLPLRVRSSQRWTITVSDRDRLALAADLRPEVARLEEMLGRRMPWTSPGLR